MLILSFIKPDRHTPSIQCPLLTLNRIRTVVISQKKEKTLLFNLYRNYLYIFFDLQLCMIATLIVMHKIYYNKGCPTVITIILLQ